MLKGPLKIIGAVISVVLTVACETPLQPAPTGWTEIVPLPSDFEAVALAISNSSYAAYVLGAFPEKGAVLAFEGSGFEVIYETPRVGPWLPLIDIAYADGVVWVGGLKEEAGSYVPRVLRYDGRNWREDVFPQMRGWVTRVMPVNAGAAWLLISNSFLTEGGRLYKFYNGELESYDWLGEFSSAAFLPEYNLLYGLRRLTGAYVVYVSGDAGANWHKESVNFESPAYELEQLKVGVGAGDQLYLLARFSQEIEGIIKRTGLPGEGVYELAFLSNNNATFSGLNAMARDYHGNLAAVGEETSVFWDGQNWLAENVAARTYFVDVAAGPLGGFYAVGRDYLFAAQAALFYHR